MGYIPPHHAPDLTATWLRFPVHTITPSGSCSCEKPTCWERTASGKPNGSPGKHPRTKNGLKDASAEPSVISAWDARWPGTNWAARTGPESKFWVLDVDGADGLATLGALEAEHGPLPATLTATTGSGGRHYLFRWPATARVPNSCRKLGPGLDVRGDGGYIVIAPANHWSGGVYAWDNDLPLADAPAWLLDVVCGAKPAPTPDTQQRPSAAPSGVGHAIRYAAAAFDGEVSAVRSAREGVRNITLNNAALALGSLVGAGFLTESLVRSALTAAASDAGLSVPEIEATLNSGLRAGIAQPRQIPEPTQRPSRQESWENQPPRDDCDYDHETGEIHEIIPEPSAEPGSRPAASALQRHADLAPIPLGYDHGVYYYLSQETGQVEDIAAEKHTEAMLCHLASAAQYWERTRFMGEKGVYWKQAADSLRSACKSFGIYDPDRLRGRGCWFDAGRAVLHLGHELIVDGVRSPLLLPDSDQVYERGRKMAVPDGEPLKNHAAKRLADLCAMITFETSDMAVLFAGWLVIAPVCAALRQRPHLWLSGSAGSGKTWIIDNIVGPLLSHIALRVGSKTTEAGIRGELGSDGRPILFDEAETQSERDRDRMQFILDLARQAYSEDGSAIIKGTATGGSKRYSIRSSFFFSSINLGLTQAADESRTISIKLPTVADLSEEGKFARAERFRKLSAEVAAVVTREYAGCLLSRTMGMLRTIRDNAETYAQAVAEVYGSRRQGDTIGAALAGYAALHHTRIVGIDEARAFIQDRSWVADAVARTETVPDHEKALNHLLEQMVKVPKSGATIDMPIINVIACSLGLADNEIYDPGKEQSRAILLQSGIKTDAVFLWLAKPHASIDRLFEKSPWGTSWPSTLLQTPGAQSPGKTMRFGHATKKGIGIPISLVLKG